MFHPLSDTIPDSLSLYLRAAEPMVHPDLLKVDLGRFDYLPLEDDGLFFAIDSTFLSGMQNTLPGRVGLPLPVSDWMTSALFLVFLLCFLFSSLVVRDSRGTFFIDLKNRLSLRRDIMPGHKKQVTTAEVWGGFFMTVQVILLGAIVLFGYLLSRIPISLGPTAFLLGFGIIFLGLSLFAGLKFLMYRAISSFFLTVDLLRWRGYYYSHLQLLGLTFFLPALVFIFLPEHSHAMLYILLLLFLMNRGAAALGLLNIFVKNKVGPIYFILYLCGTEIAPYMLLYKGACSIVNFAGNYLV
ncbi:MAG TPA: DUF4271 domain-containing protein [Bacteroidales bacterium]|nr:DUF4271 domain-containing protein [Bacteroidales bacterium]